MAQHPGQGGLLLELYETTYEYGPHLMQLAGNKVVANGGHAVCAGHSNGMPHSSVLWTSSVP